MAARARQPDNPIQIADAALYLKTHQPSLGITDPYELTQPQFQAAVSLLAGQRTAGGRRLDHQVGAGHRRARPLKAPGLQ